MSDISKLLNRMEEALTQSKQKLQAQQQEILNDVLERKKRLEAYSAAQARVVEIAKPRMEALSQKAGVRATVTPMVTDTHRSCVFDFHSPKAQISLAFDIAPDLHVKNLVVTYDLKIVPVLWRFRAHDEYSTPIENLDLEGISQWLDDRIIEFVELFIAIHESEFYEKAEYVEDPVAKVKFPKFAAGATLEANGQTLYFINNETLAQYQSQTR